MNEEFLALSREAGIAAEHMAIGVTALGKANYAQEAYYGQAFFALSVGLERASKLAIVIDYALQHAGAFPSNKTIRNYSHNLKTLLNEADAIAVRNGLQGVEDRLPRSPIQEAMLDILGDFATNGSRYYNLDLVTKSPTSINALDPIPQWWESVVIPILDKHYKPHHRGRQKDIASLIQGLIGDVSLVRHHTETGDPLHSVGEASVRTGATKFAAPYVRLYMMQIVRFLARLLSRLGYLAQTHQIEHIPYFAEHFAIFNNNDEYFKRRKSWSIYGH